MEESDLGALEFLDPDLVFILYRNLRTEGRRYRSGCRS